MESISSVGLHCRRIGAGGRGGCAWGESLGCPRGSEHKPAAWNATHFKVDSKLSPKRLQLIPKLFQWAQHSCLERSRLQSDDPTDWRQGLSFRGQGLMASLVNCFLDRRSIQADTTRRGRIICSSRKNGKWNQLSRDKTMFSSLFEWHHKVNFNQVSWEVSMRTQVVEA